MFLLLSFASCGPSKDELEQRFDAYSPDDNVVAIWDGQEFYFADHTLKLYNIIENENLNGGYLFANDRLFFSTSRQNGITDYSFLVYECDYYGNNKKLIFEKSGYKTHPWATADKNMFYVEHYNKNTFDKSSRIIDSFDIISGEYITVSEENNKKLSDYKKNTKKNYVCNYSADFTEIINNDKNTKYRIDNESLLNSDFGEALKGLDYSCYTFLIFEKNGKDQIYLIYRIKSNTQDYILKYIDSILPIYW